MKIFILLALAYIPPLPPPTGTINEIPNQQTGVICSRMGLKEQQLKVKLCRNYYKLEDIKKNNKPMPLDIFNSARG